jgi:hypothetical protein
VDEIGLDTIGSCNIQQEPILHQNQNPLRKDHPFASIEQSKTWYELAWSIQLKIH